MKKLHQLLAIALVLGFTALAPQATYACCCGFGFSFGGGTYGGYYPNYWGGGNYPYWGGYNNYYGYNPYGYYYPNYYYGY